MQKPVKLILRSAWRLALILALSGLLAACRGQTTTNTDAAPLRVEWRQWQGDYTLLIAQEKGFFKKHGVQVEPVYYEHFSEALPDLAGARTDIGLFGIVDALNVANISAARVVAVYDAGGVTSLVAAPEIKTLADLKGKQIGAVYGSSAEMVIQDVLRQAGLTLQDVTLVDMAVEAMPGRLQTDIQAGVTYEPYTSQALAAGNHNLTESGMSALLPDVIVARDGLVTEHPEAVRAFLAAWFEAVAYRQSNPLESNQIISKLANVSATELLANDAALYSLEDNRRLFAEGGVGEELSIYQIARTNLDFMVSSGGLTNLLDVLQIFDATFLPADETAMGR